MSDDAPEIEAADDASVGEATLVSEPLDAAKAAELKARCGGSFRAYKVDDHIFVLRKPKRAEYLHYKAQMLSTDTNTRVLAPERLARVCVVPFDAAGTVADERKAFDELAEDAGWWTMELFGPAVVALWQGERTFIEKKAVTS